MGVTFPSLWTAASPTVILPEDISSITKTALQWLLEEGSCKVLGETEKRCPLVTITPLIQ